MKKIASIGVSLLLLLLVACGGKTEKKSDVKPADSSDVNVEEKQKDTAKPEEKDETAEGSEQEDNQEAETVGAPASTEENTSDDSAELNTYLAERTGGDIKVVFTNKDPKLEHAYSDKVKIKIDEYQIVHVSNMNESEKINFDDEEEGYVLTFKMTLDNQSDEDVYFTGGLSFLSDDAKENIISRKHLVNRDEWMKDDSTEDVSQYSKGKSFTGKDAFAMTKAQFERLEMPILKIDSLFLDGDTSKGLGEQAVFPIPFTEEGLKKAESTAKLYPDKLVTDTIADKELFFSKEDINETKEIDQVKVTLHGVQYAKITPTEGYKESFKNFGDGPLVALTAKVTLKNDSDTAFDKNILDVKLHIDEDRGTMLSQGMLEPTAYGSVEPGDTFEKLIVFLFREDEFQIFKKFELQVGPLADDQAQRLFKEKSVMFDLPVKE